MASDTQSADQHRKGYTPKKGRPTPKRNEVERARGVRRTPTAPPETAKEARARRKALKQSMSKEEYKALKKKEREERAARSRAVQQGIDRGDERYLLDRDKGEVRAFARDWVDARRFLSNAVMPMSLVLLVGLFIAQSYPESNTAVSMVAMLVMGTFFIEGYILGSRVTKAAKQRFPDAADTGFALGFYAYSRASQPRKLRSPKPRVEIGADV
ncbi:DUF3043 domain-containing protein [Corynebacterium sp.]|uniref:DUF3043 domain-containing protein n=1 Tax=Corynebacterium sp. TaxID=1720 RepID=UPI0026DBF253|nr:DUF3043 domain-containing protein [Corynebacterium sp.]MDO5075967.1 DUF3043 domain-containing protein [Corynebacterium sp.]